jgi:hypothetical protein
MRLEAEDGFIHHQQTYEELFHSKKRVMDCVDCHNVHESSKHSRGLSIKTTCESCHFNNEQYRKISDRRHATCVECHMPNATKSAVGDLTQFSGDLRTHLMAINPLETGQLTRDEAESLPYLGLEFTCRGCHFDGGRGAELTDEQLIEAATGYHDRELTGSLNRQR